MRRSSPFLAARAVSPTPSNTPPGQADAGPGAPDARLDVGRLDERAAHYFDQGFVDATLKTYCSGHNRFCKYCELSGCAPLPETEVVLGGFVVHLADEGLKYRSIKTYLSGVRYFHIKVGVANPFQGAVPRLDYIMRGIKKNEAL